jgi:hypothetical protein
MSLSVPPGRTILQTHRRVSPNTLRIAAARSDVVGAGRAAAFANPLPDPINHRPRHGPQDLDRNPLVGIEHMCYIDL